MVTLVIIQAIVYPLSIYSSGKGIAVKTNEKVCHRIISTDSF